MPAPIINTSKPSFPSLILNGVNIWMFFGALAVSSNSYTWIFQLAPRMNSCLLYDPPSGFQKETSPKGSPREVGNITRQGDSDLLVGSRNKRIRTRCLQSISEYRKHQRFVVLKTSEVQMKSPGIFTLKLAQYYYNLLFIVWSQNSSL